MEDKEKLHTVMTTSIAAIVTAGMGGINNGDDAAEIMAIIHCALVQNLAALAQFSNAPPEEFVAFSASYLLEVIQLGNESPARRAERMLKDVLNKRGE